MTTPLSASTSSTGTLQMPATVGQLNDAGVFYLQSRGIGKADAELMLSLGFVNALVDQLPLEGLAVWVRAAFARWFAERSGRGATP